MRLILILCLTMPLALSTTSRATVHRVPDDYTTIQSAIDYASNGDTVMVADGVYRGDGNRDIVLGDIDLLVMSSSGPDACIIDCEGSNEDRHNAFNFTQNADVELSGFAITNGFLDGGGAISAVHSSPRIRNCVFYGNHARVSGGAVYIGLCLTANSSPNIQNCVFYDNHATIGGAVCVVDSRIDPIANCLFIGNTAQDGGAIFVGNSSPTIYQSTFIENVGIAQITTENYAYPSVHYCLFAGSTVHSWPECCVGYPIVGPSGSLPLNCINFRRGTYTDLWNVDDAGYFDIDPQICSQDSVSYEVHSASPCLPENNEFNKRIGYQSEVCTPTGIEDADAPLAIPDSPVLHQNFPNPFNPITEISFSLPVASDVTLEIFNISGQKVATAVRDYLGIGSYTVEWKGTDHASGVYIYKLTADDFTDTKKMVLTK